MNNPVLCSTCFQPYEHGELCRCQGGDGEDPHIEVYKKICAETDKHRKHPEPGDVVYLKPGEDALVHVSEPGTLKVRWR
jgi:hypothetical protein